MVITVLGKIGINFILQSVAIRAYHLDLIVP